MNEKTKEARRKLAQAKLAVLSATDDNELERLKKLELEAKQDIKYARLEEYFERMVERNDKRKRR